MASRFLLVTLLFPVLLFSEHNFAAVVEYEFAIDVKEVNLSGVPVEALAIDGKIPGPTLTAAVGDTLRATFHNRLDVHTSVHWHGILLPGDQDGVPYLNTQPIGPGMSHTFEFAITHAGTFWYHSHTDLQVQRGLYGAIVLTDKDPDMAIEETVVLFSDWTDEPVSSVLRNLKTRDDFYAYKRRTIQSWDKVLDNGGEAIRNRLISSMTRMGPMDLADVGYDAFLVNGQQVSTFEDIGSSATQVKLRMINGSTSSYYDVEYASGPMTVIASDGQDVMPIKVQRLRISTAETYDVLVPLVSGRASELRATSIDGSGYSSLFIGEGQRVVAPDVSRPNLFLTNHMDMPMDMHMDMDRGGSATMPMHEHGGSAMTMHEREETAKPMHEHEEMPMHQHKETAMSMPEHKEMSMHEHEETAMSIPMHLVESMGMHQDVIAHMTDYSELMATESTQLPVKQQWREIDLRLTGNMERYVWSFNGKTAHEDPQILIKKGENVRLLLNNDTMMHHPLHLHGHFFRVVNQYSERSPLKHTVNVPPMGSVIIEFDASEEEDWLFHCHNQYHMKTGMNRVVSYEDTSLFSPEIEKLIKPSKRWFDVNDFHAMSSFFDYELSFSDERNEFRFELDTNISDSFEIHATYDYYFSRFVSGFAGVEVREHHHGNTHDFGIAGLNVTLPMLINSEWRVNDHGQFRLELQSELQFTRHFGFDWRWNTDNEYRYGINYRLNNRVSLTLHTDTEYGDGVGIKFFY
ncbi:MAG: multicopper oxidase domain-containing protein [Gammaproteobacteria bacterium]|nr:multicopper oxidase domain-containing protein [Gammaproteobacteria bacterium]